MKLRNYIKTALLSITAISLLSSCLKDNSTTVDFSKGGQSAEIPLSGLNNFAADAIIADTAELAFGVNIASSSTLSRSQDITVDIIPSLVDTYNKANPGIVYEIMPASAYTFKTTTVTIPAGGRYKIVTFRVDKYKLDPSKSYMLPIGITKADGLTISANQSVKYYHVIGNDFAGTYKHQFTRTPAAGNFTYAAGNTSTFFPDSPTQFEVAGAYYTGTVRYVVSFTKSGAGANTTYSHFTISINASDLANILTLNGISVTTPPAIIGYVEKEYTFAEALALFDNGFQYSVLGSSGARTNLDQYKK